VYNFSELKTNVGVLVQRSDDSSYLTEIGTWINLGLQTLYNSYDSFLELRNRATITTTDGTDLYYMPKDLEKPLKAYNFTDKIPLTILTEEEYTDGNINNLSASNEGNPRSLYFVETVGVKRQVSTSGGTVQAKSSGTETGTGIIVHVEGYLDSSLTIIGSENITVTGTSFVAGAVTFYKILNVSKSADSVGYITLADSSGNTLSVIDPVERVVRHKAFRLGLIPNDSATSIRVLYKKRLKKLVNAYDYPFVECDDYLIYNAASMAFQQDKETIDRAVTMAKFAENAKFAILTREQSKLGPDYQHKYISAYSQAHRA
jgi:hypothetical protein